MQMKNIDVSIILPCYNEEKNLENAVMSIRAVMGCSKYSYEIIIAEDGSTDNTPQIAKRMAFKYKNIRWLHRGKRMGRGSGVENGILNSKGAICGFVDVDLATPAYYVPLMVSTINSGADIATALRVYKLTLSPNILLRWLLHKGYKFLVRIILKTPLRDTETGFKFFRKSKVLPLLNEVEDKHWFWDTEIMVRSYYKGMRIIEVPTIFLRKYHTGSTVNIFGDTKDYFVNLIRFKRKLKQLR